MHNWKVIPMIQSLIERQEIETFEEWCKKLPKGQDGLVFNYYKALYSLTKNDRIHQVSSEEIWQKMRPDTPYKDGCTRQYRIELKDKIERFWMEQALQRDDEMVRLLTFRELKERNLRALLEKAYKHEKNNWTDKPILGFSDQWFLFQVEMMRNQLWVKDQEAPSSNLPSIIEAFMTYMMTNLLNLACIDASQGLHLFEEQDDSLFSRIFPLLIEHEPRKDQGLYFLYYHLYQFIQGEPKSLNIVCDTLTTENHTLSQTELFDIFALLNNVISKKMNQGEFKIWEQTKIDLYQWGMNVGISFSHGELNPTYYRNYIITCIRAEQYQLAFQSIHEWKQYLPKEAYESYHFCLGFYHYCRQEYNLMTPHWYPNVQFKNVNLLIFSRLINLQKDYEQYWGINENEIAETKNRIRPFLQFIQRKKSISEVRKEAHKLRLTFFRRLLRQMKQSELLTFQQEIQETPGLDNRKWFLEQIEKRIDS